MAKAFLFHNPRCSKSRQALNLLEKEKENFEKQEDDGIIDERTPLTDVKKY